MKSIPKRRLGFSLTEVMVTMTIASLLVPSVLFTSHKISAMIKMGSNRNKVNAEIRKFDQKMAVILKQCSPNFKAINYWNLEVEYYHSDTGEWTKGLFRMLDLEDSHPMVFYPDFLNEPDTYEVIADGVYIIGDLMLEDNTAKFPAFELNTFNGSLLVDIKFGTGWVAEMKEKKGGYRVESGIRFRERYFPGANRPMGTLVKETI